MEVSFGGLTVLGIGCAVAGFLIVISLYYFINRYRRPAAKISNLEAAFQKRKIVIKPKNDLRVPTTIFTLPQQTSPRRNSTPAPCRPNDGNENLNFLSVPTPFSGSRSLGGSWSSLADSSDQESPEFTVPKDKKDLITNGTPRHPLGQLKIELYDSCLESSTGPEDDDDLKSVRHFGSTYLINPNVEPAAHFNLLYKSTSQGTTLTMHVQEIENLKGRKDSTTERKSNVYVKASLEVHKKSGGKETEEDDGLARRRNSGDVRQKCYDVGSSEGIVTVQTLHKQRYDPTYGNTFTFYGQTIADIQNSLLNVELLVSRLMRPARMKQLAKGSYPLSQIDVSSSVPTDYSLKLLTSLGPPQPANSSNRKQSIPEPVPAVPVNILNQTPDNEEPPRPPSPSSIGQLMLLLQYQAEANRMKLVVRRAAGLRKRRKTTIGQPVYYVSIEAVRDNELISTQQTHTEKGRNPVWNEQFLFDIPFREIERYSLRFVVYESGHRFLGKSGKGAGYVKLGTGVPWISSQIHWREAVQPRPVATARWHDLQPIV